MRIFIAGLGLIGASYAEGLTKKGHEVYGYNRTKKTEEIALERGYVRAVGLEHLSKCEVVILGFYPKMNVTFVHEHLALFKRGQVLTDVSGTKTEMVPEIEQLLPEGVSYCSHHPMAGRESSGIEKADYKMFSGTNFLMTPSKLSTEESIQKVKQIGMDLGFKKITLIDPVTHDKLIGFTSQLPHAMAVALVNSDTYDETSNFTGDSYRDLTRIAMINASLWSELFFENKKFLIEEIEKFEEELNKIKEAIITNDSETLEKLFMKSTEKRKTF